MSGSALLSALVVGSAVGVAGRLIIPGRKVAPVWLTLALGVAAALLGSIVTRLAGASVDELAAPQLIVQSGFAALAVVLAIITAGRRRQDGSSRP